MFWNKDKIPNLKLEEDEDLFTMDDNKKDVDDNQIDIENYEEIDNDYADDFYETYEDEEDNDYVEVEKNNKFNMLLINKIVNITLIVVIVLGLFIFIDVIAVTRFNSGPFFALKTKTYSDGGTKEYHGIFYKVIKYKEKSGRVDTIIGSWDINYDTTPISIGMLDLALNFNNDLGVSLDNYMDKYLKVEGEVVSVNKNYITLKYKDDGKKYNTTLKCNVLNEANKYKTGEKVEVVGTLYNYEEDDSLKLYMKNCYVK